VVALKVDVAPKVGFLPQKSFRSVIPFADRDLPAGIFEFVLCLPPGFTLVGLLVELKSSLGWFCLICDFVGVGKDLSFPMR
jgi:hypothetical protein